MRTSDEPAGGGLASATSSATARPHHEARHRAARPRISGPTLTLAPALVPEPELQLVEATGDSALVNGYRALRRAAFVQEQQLFTGHDLDAFDDDARTRVLVVVDRHRRVVGGVRIHPVLLDGPELAWWRGSRLVAQPLAGMRAGEIGAHLVTGACVLAAKVGALRFDAHVQPHCERFFARLGWELTGKLEISGAPHLAMRWPIDRIERLVRATKSPLGRLTTELLRGGPGWGAWLGDDGVPLPGSDLVACADAILPAMVERDPEWAGWCGMLVTAHDLAAMGAAPLAALDTVAARDEATLARVISGLRRGAEIFDLPIAGGHTQVGTGGALSLMGLGRTTRPVPASGGAPGDALTVTADLGGGWRPGYPGRQWDSSTHRTKEELGAMLAGVREAQPNAAKDVSMAGLFGTAGMLAEASGCGAEFDVTAIPRPPEAGLADWLTCFPGFATVTADRPGAELPQRGPTVAAECGQLTARPGVRLRWPDGEITTVLTAGATGLGAAPTSPSENSHA